MNWLQGGPYYELSFLIKNSSDKGNLLRTILKDLESKSTFKVINSEEEIKNRIEQYVIGQIDGSKNLRNFYLNSTLQIAGDRKSKLNISELSRELVKVNFWFYGSKFDAQEWNQNALLEEDKMEFKVFFNVIKELLKPVLGTIAYEEDCEELFLTEELSPSDFYSIKNIKLDKINERINRNVNEFEYCWIDGREFNREENIEIEIKTA